jgi:hypothetical protein
VIDALYFTRALIFALPLMNHNNHPLNPDPKSITYRIGRLSLAALITILIFSFSPYNNLHSKNIETGDKTYLHSNSIPLDRTAFKASFPGGNEDLEVLVKEAVSNSGLCSSTDDNSKICVMKITVDAEGVVTNAESLGSQQDSIVNVALKAIEEGPQWRPAIIDGSPVKSIVEQPIDISPITVAHISPSLEN